MEKEEVNESIKNVSDKWLSQILDSLNELEGAEKLMRDGVETLGRYIEILASTKNPEMMLSKVQVKNMAMMISKFEMVFTNVGEIIEKKKLDAMKKTLSSSKENYYLGLDSKSSAPIFKTIVHHNVAAAYHLESMFFKIKVDLCKLRLELVKNLKHILFSQKLQEGTERER